MNPFFEFDSSNLCDVYALSCENVDACALFNEPNVDLFVVVDSLVYPSIQVKTNKFYKGIKEKYEKIDLFI